MIRLGISRGKDAATSTYSPLVSIRRLLYSLEVEVCLTELSRYDLCGFVLFTPARRRLFVSSALPSYLRRRLMAQAAAMMQCPPEPQCPGGYGLIALQLRFPARPPAFRRRDLD